jgi:hypothetical protein
VYQVDIFFFMDNQSSALIYQHSLNLLAFRGLKKNASHRCIRAARSLDFEEIIAMPTIFMIISQRFDVKQTRKSGGRIMIDSCKETMTLSARRKASTRSFRQKNKSHRHRMEKKKSQF